MKVAELLAICKELMRTLHGFGIKIDDYQYLELYADYIAMSKERLKVTYIVSVLASKYNITHWIGPCYRRCFGTKASDRRVP